MLREQVITPRPPGRSGGGGKGRGGNGGGGQMVQRPARRGARRASGGATKHRVLAYLPLLLQLLLAVGTGLVLFFGYRAAASASFFQVRSIEVVGTSRVSADEIRAIVHRAAAPVGVWRADISSISAELSRQPWVRAAVVSRVLPSGLRVRIREREPLMVARTAAGRLVWVDDEGVMLGSFAPSDRMNSFIVRGLEEGPTGAALAENRERMQKALAMAREWEALGIANRVSEVNLADMRDVRVQLAGNDSQFEVRIGREDFGSRLAHALKKLDELPPTTRSAVRYLDAWSRPRNIVLGLSRDAQAQTFAETLAAERAKEAAAHEETSGAQANTATVGATADGPKRTREHAATTQTAGHASSPAPERASSPASERRTSPRAVEAKRPPAEHEKKQTGTRPRQTETRPAAGGVTQRPRRVG